MTADYSLELALYVSQRLVALETDHNRWLLNRAGSLDFSTTGGS